VASAEMRCPYVAAQHPRHANQAKVTGVRFQLGVGAGCVCPCHSAHPKVLGLIFVPSGTASSSTDHALGCCSQWLWLEFY
jgi:hypothetical protein